MLDWKCACTNPGQTCPPLPCLQYIFTLRNLNCSSCPLLVFNSSSVVGLFPGLTQDTLVRCCESAAARVPRCRAFAVCYKPSPPPLAPAVQCDRGGRGRTGPQNQGEQLAADQNAEGRVWRHLTAAAPPAPPPSHWIWWKQPAAVPLPPPATAPTVRLPAGPADVLTTQPDTVPPLPINMLWFLPCSVINGTEPVNSTSAVVDIIPPANLQCVSFKLKLCPIRPPSTTCVIQACPAGSRRCVVNGLAPGTTYSVTLICVDKNGGETEVPGDDEVTTPPELSLLSAAATSSTTGTATADPDPTNAFVLVRWWLHSGCMLRTPCASRRALPCCAAEKLSGKLRKA